jgi:hypothetical protein
MPEPLEYESNQPPADDHTLRILLVRKMTIVAVVIIAALLTLTAAGFALFVVRSVP